MSEENYTTIRLSKNIKARIDAIGSKSDSYDDILKRMLDIFELKRADELLKAKTR